MAAGKVLAAIFIFFLASLTTGAQSLSVLPVNIFFGPGEKTTSLTVTNSGTSATAIQIRAYAWNQKDNDDQLTASSAVVVSPPLVTIAPGTLQVIRLILRQSPQDREDTYRILLDQIPPPAEAGVVHFVLRLSLPIFAKPAIRSSSEVRFHMERSAGQIYLVASNAGNLHEVIRDIVLTASDGRKLKADSGASPYILSGATRRWHINAPDSLPVTSDTLKLTAHSGAGDIEDQVRFVPGS